MNVISQEHPEDISSDLAQTSTWTQGWTDYNFVVKGQGHCDLTKYVFDHN